MQETANNLTKGDQILPTAEQVLSADQKQVLTAYCWCLLVNRKYQKAALGLTVLYQIDPNQVDVVQMLCYASLKIEDYQTALKLSEQLLALDSRHRVVNAANLLKSRALMGLGNDDEARALMIDTIRQKKRVQDDQHSE